MLLFIHLTPTGCVWILKVGFACREEAGGPGFPPEMKRHGLSCRIDYDHYVLVVSSGSKRVVAGTTVS